MAPTAIAMVPDQELRAEWLEKRRSHITASDAAKILGISPYGTAISVYREKLGIDDPMPDSPQLRRGRRRERQVLEAYEDVEGVRVDRWAPFTLAVSSVNSLFACTPDAKRSDNGYPVEAKSIRYKTRAWGEPDTDFFPEHFAVQMSIQMHCLDAPEAHLPVEFAASDDDYARYVLPRDTDMEGKLLTMLAEWWDRHIVHKVAPEPDGSKSFTDYIKARWPKGDRGVVLEASDMQETRGLELMALKHEIARMEMEEGRLVQLFQSEMEGATEIQGGPWYIHWRTNKDSVATDWKSAFVELVNTVPMQLLPAEREALIAKYTTSKTGARPFNFKER